MTRLWEHVKADGGKIDEQIDKILECRPLLRISHGVTPTSCMLSTSERDFLRTRQLQAPKAVAQQPHLGGTNQPNPDQDPQPRHQTKPAAVRSLLSRVVP